MGPVLARRMHVVPDMWAWFVPVVGGLLAAAAAAGASHGTASKPAARYPLRVAPFIQQGSKLTARATGEGDAQGGSVALSSDGSTALIGGHGPDGAAGAAWVLTRRGRTWRQQAKLVGSGAIGGAEQGWNVALSGDGNTALVDGPADNSGVGAVWVFIRTGMIWRQQVKLAGAGAVSTPVQYRRDAVALSRDGRTALIDGIDHVTGAAWVFIRSGKSWRRQAALTGIGAIGVTVDRWGVALSGDGNTALLGRPGDNGGAGVVWVFTRARRTWSRKAKLVGSGAVNPAAQGSSTALSANGNTALVGGLADNNAAGAAWVFTRSGRTWRQQGSKLVGTGAGGAPAGAWQGWSAALSSDGNTALVGAPGDDYYAGAAWVFTRSRTTWTQAGSKLVGVGGTPDASQGSSVALSGDGNTSLLGGPEDNVGTGAAWVFVAMRALTVSLAGSGAGKVSGAGISCPHTCSKRYPAGQAVRLTATATPGSKFAGWGGACAGTRRCHLTITAREAITATFDRLQTAK